MLPMHSRRRTLSRPSTIAAAGVLAGCVGAGLVAAAPASAAETTATAATVKAPTVGITAPVYLTKGSTFSLRTTATVAGARAAGATVAVQYNYAPRAYRTLRTTKLTRWGTATIAVKPWRTTAYRLALLDPSGRALGYSPLRVVHLTAAPRKGASVLGVASRYSGKPYRYGAAGPRAFDCSGFTLAVYKHFGYRLPHGATAQSRYGRAVRRTAARPGDLILFGRPGSYYHAAVYAGNGYMWDAPRAGKTVGKHRIWSTNYAVRRLV